ncbi:MAG: hypothetical protein ACRENX_13030 [Candidatus Dormibacteria bacterium]
MIRSDPPGSISTVGTPRRRVPESGQRHVHIEILHVQNCPHVRLVRSTVRRVLTRQGIESRIEEIEAAVPSPTVRVNGIEVTSPTTGQGASCRLNLPTEEQIIAALGASSLDEDEQ